MIPRLTQFSIILRNIERRILQVFELPQRGEYYELIIINQNWIDFNRYINMGRTFQL